MLFFAFVAFVLDRIELPIKIERRPYVVSPSLVMRYVAIRGLCLRYRER